MGGHGGAFNYRAVVVAMAHQGNGRRAVPPCGAGEPGIILQQFLRVA